MNKLHASNQWRSNKGKPHSLSTLNKNKILFSPWNILKLGETSQRAWTRERKEHRVLSLKRNEKRKIQTYPISIESVN